MASNVSLHDLEDFIREKIVEEGWTHSRLSLYFKRIYPGVRGFSVRSIERFCADKGIHKTSRMDGSNLQQVVSEAVRAVSIAQCPSLVRHTHSNIRGLVVCNNNFETCPL